MQNEFTDNSPMPFGKHKGKALVNVPAAYLIWLHDNGCNNSQLSKYIAQNLELLKKEAGNVRFNSTPKRNRFA